MATTSPSVFHIFFPLVLKIPPWDNMVLFPFFRRWNLRHREVVCPRSDSWELNSGVTVFAHHVAYAAHTRLNEL